MVAWLSNSLPSMEEALARNVEVKMIMPKPKEDLWEPIKRLGKHPNFDLRLILEHPETGFSIWDQKEILMTASAIDSSTPAPTLWSNNMSIVSLCQGHFECLRLKAEKVDF
jgi:hypothetical protein